MKELEVCPFCGGEATEEIDHGSWGYTSESKSVGCGNEKCPIRPRISLKTSEWKPGVGTYPVNRDEELAATWNARAQPHS